MTLGLKLILGTIRPNPVSKVVKMADIEPPENV